MSGIFRAFKQRRSTFVWRNRVLLLLQSRDEEQLFSAAQGMFTHYAVLQHIAVTRGGEPALLFQRTAEPSDSTDADRLCYWRYHTPSLQVLNATGAGDCTAAITLRAWCQGHTLQAAFRAGLAAAAASCLRSVQLYSVAKLHLLF